MAEQTDAAKRAAARKAKILARGNSGLNKLAQTARGDEAAALYGDDKPSRPATPSQPSASSESSNTTSKPSWAPPPAAAGGNDQQRQMQEQLAAMFGGLGGGAPGGGPGGEGMPDFQRMMAQMMGMEQPPTGQNLLGDMDDPAGLGGAPPGNPFAGMPGMDGTGMPDLSALGGLGGLGGMGGMGGMPGMPGMGGPRKTKVEKYFPLVHAFSIFVLAIFTAVWWEPTLRLTRYGRLGGLDLTWADRWGGLAGSRGVLKGLKDDVLGGIEVLPIFWAFTTLELILQTTRFFVLKSPPPPHSMLANFLPLMPPGLARPLVTGSRYLNLLSQTYKDGALLIFFLGVIISIAPTLSSLLRI